MRSTTEISWIFSLFCIIHLSDTRLHSDKSWQIGTNNIPKNNVHDSNPKNLSPVILSKKFCVNFNKKTISQNNFLIFFTVPGLGGNKLKAVLDKSTVPHFLCSKTTNKQEPYDLWLNPTQFVPFFTIDCWVCKIANIKFTEFSFLSFELND